MLVDILIKERDGNRGFYVPWLPEKIDYSSGGAVVASYDIMNRGPVEVPTGTGLAGVSWSGTFPGINRTDTGMRRMGEDKAPSWYHTILEDWRKKGTVLTLIVYCYPINLEVTIEDYSGAATGAFGDWDYTVKFKEHRDLTLWLIKPTENAASTNSKAATSTGQTYMVTAKAGLRVREGPGTNYARLGVLPYGTTVQVLSITGNWASFEYQGKTAYLSTAYLKYVPSASSDAPSGTQRATASGNTYTIKSGDSLWKIASQQLGNGARWQEIFTLNQAVLEQTAQKYKKHCTLNYPIIYAGTVISLPAK